MDLEPRWNWRTGYWDVPIPIPGRRRKRWVTTGAPTEAEARKVIQESGVDRLVLLARSGALTESAISIVTAGKLVTAGEIRDGWAKETAERLSPCTMQTYVGQIGALFGRQRCDTKPLSAITRATLQAFVNQDAKLSTRSVRLAAIRSLYKYARAYNFVTLDLAATVFVARREMTIEQLEGKKVFPLTVEDYRTLMASPEVRPFWKRMTALGYWTGLRFVDCVSLEWSSINDDFLIVWTKKRGARVAIPLDDPLLGAGELRAIFAEMRTETGKDKTYCFPKEREIYHARKSRAFPTQYGSLLRRHGILWKSFHSTRHAAITRLAIAGRSLEEIGRVVGHSETATTASYLNTLLIEPDDANIRRLRDRKIFPGMRG